MLIRLLLTGYMSTGLQQIMPEDESLVLFLATPIDAVCKARKRFAQDG